MVHCSIASQKSQCRAAAAAAAPCASSPHGVRVLCCTHEAGCARGEVGTDRHAVALPRGAGASQTQHGTQISHSTDVEWLQKHIVAGSAGTHSTRRFLLSGS